MNGYPRSLVHSLIASQLHVAMAHVGDEDRFADLGLQPTDLVVIVLRLEQFDGGQGEFPLAALERAETVGDLVILVHFWLQRETRESHPARAAAAHRAH